MQENKLIKTVEQNNSDEPMTPQRIAAIYINGYFAEDFDVTSFCEERGIPVVDALNVSRLCQIGEERLKEAWSYFEQTTPEMMENLRNPDVLYQQAVAYLRR